MMQVSVAPFFFGHHLVIETLKGPDHMTIYMVSVLCLHKERVADVITLFFTAPSRAYNEK